MTSWTRIREVFEGAVELEGGARERFLEEECGPDAQLRAEVLRLLAADGSALPALERLADELLEDLSERAGASLGPPGIEDSEGFVEIPGGGSLEGRDLGSYRIHKALASGGMGTVYEAQQVQPERRVALKVMKRELLTGDGRRRFEY